MGMTLEQLRVFVAVAERLHVTQAAAALHLTQSAVSAALRALENASGCRLFHRVGRGIELSEAGQVLLPEARAVLRRVADAEQALDDLAGLRRGRLALGASQTIASYWLPPLLHRFQQRYPGVTLSVTIDNTARIATAVRLGEADLGLVEGAVDEPLLVQTEVGRDRLILVVGRGHAWASSGAAPALEALAGSPWVLRERGSGTRQMFEDALRHYGLEPDRLAVALELPGNEAVCSAVEAGAGATVISRLVASARLATGSLIALPLAFPERRFLALRHGDRQRSRAQSAFLDLIRE